MIMDYVLFTFLCLGRPDSIVFLHLKCNIIYWILNDFDLFSTYVYIEHKVTYSCVPRTGKKLFTYHPLKESVKNNIDVRLCQGYFHLCDNTITEF